MTLNKLMNIFSMILTLGFVLSTRALATAGDKPVLTLKMSVVGYGESGARAGQSADVVIERWSTDAERILLRDILLEHRDSPEKLLMTLQAVKPRVGVLRTGGTPGWDVLYAREEVDAVTGLHHVVIATDCPMSNWERTTPPNVDEYEFTLAEIRLSPKGRGEGKLVPAAKVRWNADAQAMEIENYSLEPVRLRAIRTKVKK